MLKSVMMQISAFHCIITTTEKERERVDGVSAPPTPPLFFACSTSNNGRCGAATLLNTEYDKICRMRDKVDARVLAWLEAEVDGRVVEGFF